MHPDPSFRVDADACRALVRDVAFAHLFVRNGDAAAVIHAPVVLEDEDALTFHVSRRNHAAALLPGAQAIVSVVGPHGYVSPDWYATTGQVPTWNYVAAEAEGVVEPLSRDELLAQIDALGDQHEVRLAPKPCWTREKMPADRVDAMVAAIAGFRLRVATWRGTAKLSQNKPARDIAGVVAALRALGRDDLADAVAAPGHRPGQTASTAPVAMPHKP
ncbi:FMN-binding negative transcriptional regulator [Sphingomonas adhaesiva]|uniref:FMN-binding negative transcriptional regulator n=1 Tax=Sphingomonas adhaesiva TaxID=28212 RepID=UPI002FFB11B4